MSIKEINYTLFGCILGDGSLREYKSTAYLEISHTNKQRAYLLWKHSLFVKWGLKVHLRLDYDQMTNHGLYTYSYVGCRLPSRRHFVNGRVRDSNGKRVASAYLLNRITVLGMLLWYLDDGSLSVHTKKDGSVSRHITFSTNRYNYECHLRIQAMFLKRFDIVTAIHKDKNGSFRTYLNATNSRKFIDLVRSYLYEVPYDMLYKFDMKYEVNRLNPNGELLDYNLLAYTNVQHPTSLGEMMI